MNEELDSQLSAMFDGELPAAECELLARRLARDEQLKSRWDRYAVMGAAIRAERGVRLDSRVARRVSAAIAGEPALAETAAVPAPRAGMRWRQPLAGAAVAAGVAALAILWVRADHPPGQSAISASVPAQSAAAARGAPALVARAEQSASYVVPRTAERRPTAVPAMNFANYVVAHSEFSSPVARRALLSALVASESGGAAPSTDEPQPAEDARDDGKSRP